MLPKKNIKTVLRKDRPHIPEQQMELRKRLLGMIVKNEEQRTMERNNRTASNR